MGNMYNTSYMKAKKLILAPLVVLVITAACMGLAMILEGPTDKGTLYSIFALIGMLGIFIAPLPCFVMSVVGTVYATRAAKEGTSRKYFVIGVIEIIVYVVAIVPLAIVLFIAGQGV